MKRNTTPMDERLFRRLDRSGECWLWTGKRNASGYGMMKIARHERAVHRVAYELFVGPIPEGLQLDHLCRVRHCANPAHLEAVTQRENLLRGVGWAALNAAKTHCPKGHPYDEANTLLVQGHRFCRACQEARRSPRQLQNHCPNGHPYDDVNTLVTPTQRRCRACKRAWQRRTRSERAGAL